MTAARLSVKSSCTARMRLAVSYTDSSSLACCRNTFLTAFFVVSVTWRISCAAVLVMNFLMFDTANLNNLLINFCSKPPRCLPVSSFSLSYSIGPIALITSSYSAPFLVLLAQSIALLHQKSQMLLQVHHALYQTIRRQAACISLSFHLQ